MVKFGLYAAQEQYGPNELLEHAILGEKAGFDTIWASDHFHPWAHTNAQSGFMLSWLSAAAERTERVAVGSVATPPILRYHPAMLAQAFATLEVMYPGRIFMGLATGEAMNEVPLGYEWPPFKERLERFEEALTVIRKLWSEGFVTFKGKYFRLNKANLYTKPKSFPPIIVAANGPSTAYVAGKYADGFLTSLKVVVGGKYESELEPALKRGLEEAGRSINDIERVAHVMTSYDEDYERALEACRFWNASLVPLVYQTTVYDPRVLEETGKLVSDKAIADKRFIATSPDEAIDKIEDILKHGFEHIEFLSTSPDQEKFIRVFGEKVIPYFRK